MVIGNTCSDGHGEHVGDGHEGTYVVIVMGNTYSDGHGETVIINQKGNWPVSVALFIKPDSRVVSQ